FARAFGLVLIPYNSVQLLDAAARRACLQAVAGALSPRGRLALETTDFHGDVTVTRIELEPLGEAAGIFLEGGVVHDLTGRSSVYTRRFSGDGWTVEDAVTIWSVSADELRQLVEAAGFAIDELAQDGSLTRCVATLRKV